MYFYIDCFLFQYFKVTFCTKVSTIKKAQIETAKSQDKLEIFFSVFKTKGLT